MGFGPPITPPIVKQLLIANAAIFVLQLLFQGWGLESLTALGAATPREFWSGAIWQPFTYMFLHGGIGHIAMNMLALWMFGSPLALVWGTRRFLRFYLFCGVAAGLLIVTLPYLAALLGLHFSSLSPNVPTLGASGAIYGLLLAYSLTWPNRTIMLIFPPVAFRAIWLIPILFLMESMTGPSNVSHVGHLGGAVAAWLYLRRDGGAGSLPTLEQLRYRWRRYRMRGRLRAVRREDEVLRERSRNPHDRTLH